MPYSQITYQKQCSICGEKFVTKRAHAVTCSGRCRFILHKLNKSHNEFGHQVDFELFELSPSEIRFRQDYIRNKGLLDNQGNQMDFINGYKDIKGDLKILVFKINALKCLEVWNDTGDDITVKCFKYK